jgi:hypothetical protein
LAHSTISREGTPRPFSDLRYFKSLQTYELPPVSAFFNPAAIWDAGAAADVFGWPAVRSTFGRTDFAPCQLPTTNPTHHARAGGLNAYTISQLQRWVTNYGFDWGRVAEIRERYRANQLGAQQ